MAMKGAQAAKRRSSGIQRRLPNRALLAAEVAAWQRRRNAQGRGIPRTFTPHADRKMSCHYVAQLMRFDTSGIGSASA
jgi:hypothetical protein